MKNKKKVSILLFPRPTWQHDAWVVVEGVIDVRRTVEVRPDAVAAQLRDDRHSSFPDLKD